jgi:hypothetical protein
MISLAGIQNGFLPLNAVKSLGIEFGALGTTDSLAQHFPSIYSLGSSLPVGAPILSGLPYHFLSGLVVRFVGLPAVAAQNVVGVLVLAASYWALIRTAGLLGVRAWLGQIFAGIFLLLPFLSGHREYGALQIAFLSFPLFVLPDTLLAESLVATPRAHGRKIAGLAVVSVAAKIFALFSDGYTFVMVALTAVCLGGMVSLVLGRRRQWLLASTGLTVAAAGCSAAYFVYLAYLPPEAISSAFTPMSPDFFRAFSVDLVTLVLPYQNSNWWAAWIGIHSYGNPFDYFSDRSSIHYNYIGMFLPLLGLVALFRRKAWPVGLAALVAAAVLGFVFSLGPSLKINSTRHAAEQRLHKRIPGPEMPREVASLYLGLDRFYTTVPGFKNMRSTYRWLLLAKFGLVLTAAWGAEQLLRSGRRKIALALIAAAIVENLPNLAFAVTEHRKNADQLAQFDRDVLAPLAAIVPPGSVLIFPDPDLDYMASYIATRLQSVCYNAAGDKNVEIAFRQWPAEVRNLKMEREVLPNSRRLMSTGKLDWTIIPFFNLRWDSYRWPPTSDVVEKRRKQYQSLIEAAPGEGFECFVNRYFLAIRLAPPGQLHQSLRPHR